MQKREVSYLGSYHLKEITVEAFPTIFLKNKCKFFISQKKKITTEVGEDHVINKER
jgi:hypothetical protein